MIHVKISTTEVMSAQFRVTMATFMGNAPGLNMLDAVIIRVTWPLPVFPLSPEAAEEQETTECVCVCFGLVTAVSGLGVGVYVRRGDKGGARNTHT